MLLTKNITESTKHLSNIPADFSLVLEMLSQHEIKMHCLLYRLVSKGTYYGLFQYLEFVFGIYLNSF